MRLSSFATVAATFMTAGALSFVAASFSVAVIEKTSKSEVKLALEEAGLGWADTDTNGLQLFLIGEAPTEALRFKAITTAGSIIDAARVIDQMEVADRESFAPPRFSIEILRNDSGISLIGLVPDTEASERMTTEIARLAENATLSDLLESAKYPAPEGWERAVDLGLVALKQLPRSKISIDAGNVSVTAMTESALRKSEVERRLKSATPPGVMLSMNIAAPRPVITPFTLRFLIDDKGPRFDACSADTESARDRILSAAKAAGMEGPTDCQIGLGVPSKQWGSAAEKSINALAALGSGSVTIADADISLIATEGTDQTLFDRTVGELDTSLPAVFALHAVLPQPVDADQGPPEFIATLSPEGQVQLRGRLGSDLARETADSYAKARFGSDTVYTAARVVQEGLPRDWSVRVLAGIEALSMLSNGAVTVTPDRLQVTGNTGNLDASSLISGLLAEKLGEAEDFQINVTYQEKLDPVAGLPTPEECETQIAEIQSSRKITFEPGSETLDTSAESIMDDIADILKACGDDLKIEIGGHTDSQGRETMNQQLSQSRAQSVLSALRERQVLTSKYSVKGYGESVPIADNGTQEGREANRRIEFKLIRPKPTPVEETTLEALSEKSQDSTGNDTDAAEGESNEQN